MEQNNAIQGSQEWFDDRLGRVTGSKDGGLPSIMGTKAAYEGLLYQKVGERLMEHVDMENMHESSMARGKRLEPEGVAAFEYVTGKKAYPSGLVKNPENEWIAYSPDGVINESEDVEVKCPEEKNYTKILESRQVPDEYVWQITQGFCANPKLMTRWFVAYNPDIPKHPIVIIKCNREDWQDHIDRAMAKQLQFLAEVEVKLAKIKSNENNPNHSK